MGDVAAATFGQTSGPLAHGSVLARVPPWVDTRHAWHRCDNDGMALPAEHGSHVPRAVVETSAATKRSSWPQVTCVKHIELECVALSMYVPVVQTLQGILGQYI